MTSPDIRSPSFPDFDTTLAQVQRHSLLGPSKLAQLWDRAMGALPGPAIEIGVYRGGGGCLIARARSYIDPNSFMFLCDTFRGLPNVDERDGGLRQGQFAEPWQTAFDLKRSMALTNVMFVVGEFPDSAHGIAHEKFAFAHIDVDTFVSTISALEWLWPRMVRGGVIVVDDYEYHETPGVTAAVNDFLQTSTAVRRDSVGWTIVLERT